MLFTTQKLAFLTYLTGALGSLVSGTQSYVITRRYWIREITKSPGQLFYVIFFNGNNQLTLLYINNLIFIIKLMYLTILHLTQ